MTDRTTLHPALHDHALLPDLLARIEEERDVHEVRRRLGELRSFLTRHFDDETGPDGLFDELRRRRPTCQRTLAELEAEHDEMLCELSRVLRLVDQLQDGVSHIAATLRRHEAREWELTRDAYLTDLGGGA